MASLSEADKMIENYEYPYSLNDMICLKSKYFYEKALKESGETKSLSTIIQNMCRNDY